MTTDQFGVERQTAIVTGASSGIGKRVGAGVEIADVAQFLASPASSFLVGETVTAQGVPDIMETP